MTCAVYVQRHAYASKQKGVKWYAAGHQSTDVEQVEQAKADCHRESQQQNLCTQGGLPGMGGRFFARGKQFG